MPTTAPPALPDGRAPRTVDFVKLVAAGNDFILINGDLTAPPPDLPAFAARVCRRETGIGADGVVLTRHEGEGTVRATVVNPDGSIAKMCGNGARCAAYYALTASGLTALTVILAGRDRPHTLKARLAGDLVELTSPQPDAVRGPIRIDGLDYYRLDTGTEYAVAFVDDPRRLDRLDVPSLGRMIRYHPAFAPDGVSVSFAAPRPGGEGLTVRTYERGNEAETLSCGSGAVACAVAARHLGLTTREFLPVHNRSGTPLAVRISGDGPPFAELTLTGPARVVFTGRIAVTDAA